MLKVLTLRNWHVWSKWLTTTLEEAGIGKTRKYQFINKWIHWRKSQAVIKNIISLIIVNRIDLEYQRKKYWIDFLFPLRELEKCRALKRKIWFSLKDHFRKGVRVARVY